MENKKYTKIIEVEYVSNTKDSYYLTDEDIFKLNINAIEITIAETGISKKSIIVIFTDKITRYTCTDL